LCAAISLPTFLAVLRIKGMKLRALPLRDSDKLVIGETVIAIGSPLWVEGGPTVTVLTTSA
jgi:S1-C subfamily serine protease